MKHILIVVLTILCSNLIKAQDTTFNKFLHPYSGVSNIHSLISLALFKNNVVENIL